MGYSSRKSCKVYKFFKENNARIRYQEKEEITKLLEEFSPVLRVVVTVAIHTGMRKSEIQNLKWSDVNLKGEYIVLRQTKSGETRIVPMNRVVREALFLLEKKRDSMYIFCGKNGKLFDFKIFFETALKRADIKDFRFHDLRHTFASHLVMSGIDLNTTRELLGHRNLNMTLRYSHLFPDHKTRAVDILGKQLDTLRTPESILQEVPINRNVVTISNKVYNERRA